MKLFSLTVFSLLPICQCKVGYTCQRVWMLHPKHLLSHLHDLNLKLLHLLLPTLIPVCQYDVGHTHQHGWMLLPWAPSFSSPWLELQAPLPPSTNPVPCENRNVSVNLSPMMNWVTYILISGQTILTSANYLIFNNDPIVLMARNVLTTRSKC